MRTSTWSCCSCATSRGASDTKALLGPVHLLLLLAQESGAAIVSLCSEEFYELQGKQRRYFYYIDLQVRLVF